MPETIIKPKKGGARPGAGRPKGYRPPPKPRKQVIANISAAGEVVTLIEHVLSLELGVQPPHSDEEVRGFMRECYRLGLRMRLKDYLAEDEEFII